jgi:hypothetical protein
VAVDTLASYRRWLQRAQGSWPAFLAKRSERLVQQERYGVTEERVAENILEDLFTQVLGWSLSEVNNQIDYADLVLTRLGIKQLIVEAKRPGALAWNRRAVEAALAQARRYAAEQKVHCVAVSDGVMLYAADLAPGGLLDRVFIRLDAPALDTDLWWLTPHIIYRPRADARGVAIRLLLDHPSATAAGGRVRRTLASIRGTASRRVALPMLGIRAIRRPGSFPSALRMEASMPNGCPRQSRRS